MKYLFALFISLIILPSYSQVITGGVNYNSEYSLNSESDLVGANTIDLNYEENINALKLNITEFNGRKLAKFSDNSYGIEYKTNPFYTWYYSCDGKLINYTRKDSANYPTKFTKFKPNGNIIYYGMKVSESESYIYSKNGNLLVHWINGKCYDSNNNVIMIRNIIER